ncbi:MAG: hypothetical protein JJ879_10570 [Sneathiella sp.]|nr:hypothetical protein [Sneathiella sp.]
MPHAVVISTVQSLSILFLAGLIAGIYYLNMGNVCLLGGRGICLLDGILSLLMLASACITAAFTLLLFKAYTYR